MPEENASTLRRLSDNYDEKNAPISELFDKGWSYQIELDNNECDTNSDEAKSKIFSAIRVLRIVEEKLNELQLFSDNEDIDDVSTSELRYILLYALLGWLYESKPSSPKRRIDNVEMAASYFDKFLRLCASYGLYKNAIPKFKEDESIFNVTCNHKAFNVAEAAQQRKLKIEAYQRKKEEEARMKALENLIKTGKATEETERQFYLGKIKWWISVVVDDLKCLYEEMNLLKLRRQDVNERNGSAATNSAPKTSNKKPLVVITRDKLQQQVFGMGYPSVHTVSVDQFYENLAERGCIPKNDNFAPYGVPTKDKEEKELLEKEQMEESDDLDYLKSRRFMDEWKDTHKRGEGNRYNRS